MNLKNSIVSTSYDFHEKQKTEPIPLDAIKIQKKPFRLKTGIDLVDNGVRGKPSYFGGFSSNEYIDNLSVSQRWASK